MFLSIDTSDFHSFPAVPSARNILSVFAHHSPVSYLTPTHTVESSCISQLYLPRVLATVSYFPLCFFCLWCIYQFKNFIVVFSELLSIALLVYKLPVVSVRMGFPAFLYI